MAGRRRSGFTLIELLVVIVIIGLLASLLLPALVHVMCLARQATATQLVKGLTTACAAYETDQAAFPPGDGKGSADLVSCLRREGPKGQAYYELMVDMVCAEGVVNPVWAGQPSPQGVIHYRNNQQPGKGGGGGGMPAVHHARGFDIWCAGCSFRPDNPSSAWEVNNWD